MRHSNVFGLPVLVIGGVLVAAAPAVATSDDDHSGSVGKATAVAARADLNVSVKDVGNVPVQASLSEVSAPGDAEQTLLTAKVNGAHKGSPVTLVKAKVAHASAQADTQRAKGHTKLVKVRAYAPGLPANPLLSADVLKASASCVKGEKPTAKAALTDNVAVLGKPVKLNASGSQHVKVPGVGKVELRLEETATTDSTGAATALRLKYSVDPADLGVVKTTGEIVLAEATCSTPGGDGGSHSGGSNGSGDSGSSDGSAGSGGSDDADGSNGSAGSDSGDSEGAADDAQPSGEKAAGNQPETQTGDDGTNLAETGGNSTTPIIAGVGAALVLGGGAMYLIRRRNSAQNG